MVILKRALFESVLLLLLSAFSFFYLKPILLSPDNEIPFGPDTGMLLAPLQVTKEYLIKQRSLPTWNPYYQKGLPILSDPLSFVFSPILTPLTLAFSPVRAYKIALWFSFALSGYFFFQLVRELGVSKPFALLGSFLLIVSGDLTARVAAGTVEKVLAYPFLIGYFWILSRPSATTLKKPLAAVFLGLMFVNGDNYYPFFALLLTPLYLTVWNRGDKSVRSILATFKDASLFTAVTGLCLAGLLAFKILPVLETRPLMKREITPFYGSQPFPLSLTNFINPFLAHLSLTDSPTKKFLSLQYPWWDYHLFNGVIFSALFLFAFAALLKTRGSRLAQTILSFLLLIAVVLLYQALQYPYSPFHYLLKIVTPLQIFRNPARINTLLNLFSITLVVWLTDHLARRLTVDPRARRLAIASALLTELVLILIFIFSQSRIGSDFFYRHSLGLFVNLHTLTLLRYRTLLSAAVAATAVLFTLFFLSRKAFILQVCLGAFLLFAAAEAGVVNRNFLQTRRLNFDHPTIQTSFDFLRTRDKDFFYVSFPGFPLYDFAEYVALENRMRVLNAYYGFGLNDFDKEDLRAKYLFWGLDRPFDQNQYRSLFTNREHQVLENLNYQPPFSIKKGDGTRVVDLVKLIGSGLDRFEFSLQDVADGDRLEIFINYFPGWQYRFDQQRWIDVGKGNSIEIPLTKGIQLAEMRFVPTSFFIGLVISLISLAFLTFWSISQTRPTK